VSGVKYYLIILTTAKSNDAVNLERMLPLVTLHFWGISGGITMMPNIVEKKNVQKSRAQKKSRQYTI
jgi:hypothetical protein